MNRYFFVFIFCWASINAAFNPITTDVPPESKISQEMILVNTLIDVTEKNLAVQKELREELQIFEQRKSRFLKDMNNRDAAYEMVQSAYQILETLNTNHLLQMFPTEFISELTFFSQIASKKGE